MRRRIRKGRWDEAGLGTGGFSARQIMTMVVALSLTFVLLQFGTAAAVTFVNAIVTDPTNPSFQAHVDSSGNLQVGGTVGINPTSNVVTVNSATPVSVTSLDDPGRNPFQAFSGGGFVSGVATGGFTVPTGKRLVIQYVSMQINLPPTDSLVDISIGTQQGCCGLKHRLVPFRLGTDANGVHYEVGQDLTLYAEGRVGVTFEVDDAKGISSSAYEFFAFVSGYLIDCTVAPCN
jgi:hypothetical protein